MGNYPGDVTCGNWQTVNGGWGHSFGEWCYTAKEVLEEGRAICIEHARLATALLRALDIPVRPAPLMAHPVTQWWVQLPDGSGFWANMDTSVGRSRYVETGDLWANFPSVEEHVLGYWSPDADAPIHMEWWMDNPCIWREEDGQGRSYEHTPEGLQLARDGLAWFAQYGFLPTPVPPPGPGEPYYSLDVRGFVVNLTNAREQVSFDVSFPLPIESEYLQLIDYVHWTNHPEWVVRTWVETKSDPGTGESLSFYHVELDRKPGCKVYLPLVTKSYQAGFSYEVGECQETLAALTNDQVEIWVEGNDILMRHTDALYNCCAEIVVELVDRRPLFKLIEKETHPNNPPCHCLCYYEITARIEDLPPGTYRVEVWNEDETHLFGWAEVTIGASHSALESAYINGHRGEETQ
jgi:hypothetical protein